MFVLSVLGLINVSVFGQAVDADRLSRPLVQSPDLSRFDRIVTRLQQASQEDQTLFAAIAVSKLAQAYEEEIQQAKAEFKRKEGSGKLRGWIISVEHYSRRLEALAEQLFAGMPATLTWENVGQLAVSTEEGMFILSHPRHERQNLLEQAVVLEFCTRNNCHAYLGGLEDSAAPIPMSRGTVRPSWFFDGAGPVCRYQGLSVQFRQTQKLTQIRAICRQLLEELADLSHELAWQVRHGVHIDWSQLAVEAIPGRPQHLVRLNSVGDTLLMPLPLLHSSGSLLSRVQPWLRARVEAGRIEITIQAAEFGWE